MADSSRLPGAHAWTGPVQFYQWFRQVDAAISRTNTATVDLTAITSRVTALESAESASVTISGPRSVQVTGGDGAFSVQLRGDQTTPGATKYYGTNASGNLGYYSHAVSTLADVDLTGLAADDILRWNGTAWARQPVSDDAALLLADADVPRLGTVNTWTLTQTFTVAPVFTDAAGTRSALGATTVGGNLFTAPNPSAVRWIRVNADNTVTFRTAAETLADIGGEAAIAAGTTAQFWRGDKTFSNALTGDLFLRTSVRVGYGPGGTTTNIVFGSNALAADAGSSNSVAIGLNALAATTNGGNNTAIGANALAANTTGGQNTAIGQQALTLCSTASGNVGIGRQALRNYTGTGTTSNFAIGNNALDSLASGSFNLAIGTDAGFSQTSGSRNVYVGWRAGFTATAANANVTGQQNTFIGTEAGPGSTTQVSGATSIGYQALVTTSNTVVLGRTTDNTVIGATGNSAGGCKLQVTGHVGVLGAGNGLRVAEGANAKQGTAVLVAGTVTVANTSVTANSRIFLTSQVDGGTPGFLRVSARVAGTSFTITSGSATDTSTVAYEIFEPGT